MSRFALIVLLTVALAVAMLPARASAAFSSPFGLSGPAFLDWVYLDVNPSGDGLVTFAAFDGESAIFARTISTTGARGPIQEISTDTYATHDNLYDADLGASGDAGFVWLREEANGDILVRYRSLSADGLLGPVRTLDRFDLFYYEGAVPRVAVDAAGNAIATWVEEQPAGTRGDGTNVVMSRRISTAGVLGPTQVLAEEPMVDGEGGIGHRGGAGAQLAMNDDGMAIVGWLRQHVDSDISTYEARTVSPAGVRGPVETVRTLNDPSVVAAQDVQVELDPDGDAVFSWTRPACCGAPSAIEGRTLDDGTHLGLIQRLSTGQVAHPSLALDGAGNAMVVWERGFKMTQARRMSASSVLGPPLTLSLPQVPGGVRRLGTDPDVAVDADGNAVAAWRGFDGQDRIISARTISNLDALGPVQSLSASGSNAYVPAVGIDAQDRALAVWWRHRIEGALGP